MAQSLLQLSGYLTIEAPTADIGILLAQEHLPDLILMDMHLPVKSGYEACQELKSLSKTAHIPIVAFTALAMQEEQQKAINSGCAGVITKPIDVKNFPNIIQQFLNNGHHTHHASKPLATAFPNVQQCATCEESEKLKQDFEDFLLHVSHDLQGPLRKVQQFAKFIQAPSSDTQALDEKMHYIDGICRNVKEMEGLLQGLLSLSRVNVKGNDFTNFSLAEVVAEAIHNCKEEINRCNTIMEVEPLNDIQGDPTQIQRVFEELIKNALKFRATEERPQISIRGLKHSNDYYEIQVEDNGIGFPNDSAERIFEPFLRLNASSRYPGHGLGLAIVKKIVERHGGTITAHCKSPRVTTLRIQLPIQSKLPESLCALS